MLDPTGPSKRNFRIPVPLYGRPILDALRAGLRKLFFWRRPPAPRPSEKDQASGT